MSEPSTFTSATCGGSWRAGLPALAELCPSPVWVIDSYWRTDSRLLVSNSNQASSKCDLIVGGGNSAPAHLFACQKPRCPEMTIPTLKPSTINQKLIYT